MQIAQIGNVDNCSQPFYPETPRGTLPAASVGRRTPFRDVDQLAELLPRLSNHYVQLSPGSSSGWMASASLGSLSLTRMFMSNRTLCRAAGPSDLYYHVLPVRWADDLIWNGRNVAAPVLMPWGEDPGYVRTGRDLEMFVLMHDQRTFLDHASAWSGGSPDPWRKWHGEPALAGNAAARLALLFRDAFEIADQDTEVAASARLRISLGHLLTSTLLEAQEGGGFWNAALPRSLVSRMRLFRQAETYLRDRLDESISKLEVCRAVGASARSLDYAFRDIAGLTFGAYLKTHRLRLVHRLLRDGDPAGVTVKRCALQAGFFQLGRFSLEYRSFFGESPSETLGVRLRRRG